MRAGLDTGSNAFPGEGVHLSAAPGVQHDPSMLTLNSVDHHGKYSVSFHAAASLTKE